jgi:hypothetical protein
MRMMTMIRPTSALLLWLFGERNERNAARVAAANGAWEES